MSGRLRAPGDRRQHQGRFQQDPAGGGGEFRGIRRGLLKEQQLASQNSLDPATLKKIGKILGVDAMFMGTVASNVPSQSYLVTRSRRGEKHDTVTPVGSAHVSQGPVAGLPRAEVVTSAAQNSLIARLVDVETGSVLWSGRMSYEGYDNQSAMASITSSFAKSLVPLWPALHP